MVETLIRVDLQFVQSGITDPAFVTIVGISDTPQLSVIASASQAAASIFEIVDSSLSPLLIMGPLGDVGIGIVPTNKFHVSTSSDPDNFHIEDSSGFVGIGVSSPGAKLEVAGGILLAGTLDLTSNQLLRVSAGSALTHGVNLDQVNAILSGHTDSGDFIKADGSIPFTGDQSMGDQILLGSTAAGGDLYLRTTSHATKGSIFMGINSGVIFDETSNSLGIGTASPSNQLHILSDGDNTVLRLEGTGSFGSLARLLFGDPDFVFIEEEVDDFLRLHGANGIRLSGGDVGVGGVGQGAAAARMHINQDGTASNIPVLELDQDDVDVEFIEFDGASASDGSRSLSSDTGAAGAVGGKIRVTINGTTKWIRFYDDHT